LVGVDEGELLACCPVPQGHAVASGHGQHGAVVGELCVHADGGGGDGRIVRGRFDEFVGQVLGGVALVTLDGFVVLHSFLVLRGGLGGGGEGVVERPQCEPGEEGKGGARCADGEQTAPFGGTAGNGAGPPVVVGDGVDHHDGGRRQPGRGGGRGDYRATQGVEDLGGGGTFDGVTVQARGGKRTQGLGHAAEVGADLVGPKQHGGGVSVTEGPGTGEGEDEDGAEGEHVHGWAALSATDDFGGHVAGCADGTGVGGAVGGGCRPWRGRCRSR